MIVLIAVQVMAENGAAAHVILAAEAVVEAAGVQTLAITIQHVVQARMIHQHVVKLYTETAQNIAEVHVIHQQVVQTDVLVMAIHTIADAVRAEQPHLMPAVKV